MRPPIPAIARILEHLPATTTGHVLLSLESEGGKVPISLPENMSLEWIIREKDDHDALVDATCAMQDRFIENSFVFFAAKKSASKKGPSLFLQDTRLYNGEHLHRWLLAIVNFGTCQIVRPNVTS
ncbi:SIP domain-containing protein [uncultured Cohaesibacter sp.]|uniref:SIP domain-containing protein n=1 Tax=uncultured Cohaesibacter sp. TaxID=1002546 RepID=UPI003747D732